MSKLCFVIAPIGDEETEVRHRSDQILTHVIDVAAKECGYETLRSDKISEPGIITSQIIQHLLDDPLVIADMTGHNPNVFYELAVRHAIRKPVVQLIEKGEKIPFDVAATRTIQVDHHDLDSVAKCRQELTSQIRAVEKDPADVDTPISVAIDLQQLRRSGNPMEKSTAEMISMLQSLHAKIDAMPTSLPARYVSRVHEHEIRMTNPAPCPRCGTGHLLAFVIPHFEGEGTYRYGPEDHGPFSHYEVIYYCSRHVRSLSGGTCDYEAAL